MKLLILSIGSNPMPNFIVASYCINSNRNNVEMDQNIFIPDGILLIYSSDTEKFKDSIITKLNYPPQNIYFINIGDNYRNFKFIEKQVIEKLKELEPERIHLNFTGGTKSMAVAITMGVKKYSDMGFLTNDNIIYSDLVPETYRLGVDNNSFPVDGDIRDFLNVSIETIYELHNLDLPAINRIHSEFYSKEFVYFLINKFENCKEFFKQWHRWPKKDKIKNIRSEYKKIEKYNEYENERLNSVIYADMCILLESVSNYLPDDFNVNIPESIDLKRFKHLAKFVCGTYLEEYIFNLLNASKNDLRLTDLAWNIETKINRRSFEIDVIAIKGCQTFVFSCTTDKTIKLCKGKAFEAFFRAVQLGGEQTKTILVCYGDDNNEREDEKVLKSIGLDMSQFDAVRNFEIIGFDDIKDENRLINKLTEIIREV